MRKLMKKRNARQTKGGRNTYAWRLSQFLKVALVVLLVYRSTERMIASEIQAVTRMTGREDSTTTTMMTTPTSGYQSPEFLPPGDGSPAIGGGESKETLEETGDASSSKLPAIRGVTRRMKEEVSTDSTPKLPLLGCAQNPYQSSLEVSLEDVSNKLNSWLTTTTTTAEAGNAGQVPGGSSSSYQADLQEATTNQVLRQHTRERFKFFHDSMGQCASTETTCVGGKQCAEDEAKVVCGLQQLREGCIIYSVGGNNQWQFELDALEKTPCHVHTFDCTGDISRFNKPTNNDRLHFHHVCLGTKHEPKATECSGGNKCGETWTIQEMQRNLGHARIDLFKMDIEGFEWDILDSWPELNETTADQVLLPHQLLVEFHYWTQFPELRPPGTGVAYDFKTPEDFVKMAGHLARMGYAVVHKKDGRVKHCAELTIMRVQCPSTGVYDPVRSSQQKQSSSTSISLPALGQIQSSSPQNPVGIKATEIVLPTWFQEYAVWHKQQLALLTQENWKDFKYLIRRCHVAHPQCGGTADRIRAAPFMLRLGAKTKRLVFYRWDWPHPLEEFLTPTANGINWTLPSWLAMEHDKWIWSDSVKATYQDYRFFSIEQINIAAASNQTVINAHDGFGGDRDAVLYNALKNELPGDRDYVEVYHSLWNAIFQLSPPLQNLLHQQMSKLSLTPQQYTGFHYRSKYLWDESSKAEAINNATNCAVHLGNGAPILVATDSLMASETAVQYLNQNTPSRALTLTSAKEPLHIDRGANYFASTKNVGEMHQSTPSDYYDTFVDLYLLSMAKCVVYGRGSYGKWASLLSKDPSCSFSYFRFKQYIFPPENCPQPASWA